MDSQTLLMAPEDYGLLTDLYQLTMAACYVGEGLDQRWASFELFTRKLPSDYGYIIAAGLSQALDYLTHFEFSEAHLQALRQTGLFDSAPEAFWSLLKEGTFTGNVWAVPEGTAMFASEPLLRVEAPLWQAQIAETYLLNVLNYQTLIATRAARLRDVAGPVVKLLEFGTRRAFSPQGAMWAARAAVAGGLDTTSNVLAALKLGIQPSGTMAHALVMAFTAVKGDEDEAFTAFQRYFPEAALLIDTYDTVAAAERLGEKVRQGETQVAAVRLDSGDLAALSKQVKAHLPEAKILASGDLDEYEIARLRQAGAVIDGYGLGTKLVTGSPVNGVYKLVELDGIPVMKESNSKTTFPGRKQIFRQFRGGQAIADRLGLADESAMEGEHPLMQLVMKNGTVVRSPEPLPDIAQRSARSVASLDGTVRQLEQTQAYPVNLSSALADLTDRTSRRLTPEMST